MKRPALLAASLSALAAALASAQASACSPPPDGWQIVGLQPADGATNVPVDMPLVVRTQTFSGTLPTADDLAAAPPVLRDAAGEAVPGTAALAGFDGLFYFVPDAPLAPDAAYTWSITHVEPWSEQPTETTARFRTGAVRFEPAVQDAIGALGQTPVVMPLTDGCDPNGGFDSCGGCDPLVVGQRGAIDVVLSFTLEAPTVGLYGARVGLGATPDEARALAARNARFTLSTEAENRVTLGAGHIEQPTWTSERVCAALEVTDVLGRVWLDAVSCDDVTAWPQPDPNLPGGEPTEPTEPTGPTDPNEADAGSSDGGCSTTGSTSAPFFAALCLLGALRRRRR